MELLVLFPREYPHKIPKIEVCDSEGLREGDCNDLLQILFEISLNLVSNKMLFEISQATHDFLECTASRSGPDHLYEQSQLDKVNNEEIKQEEIDEEQQ